MAKRNKKLDAIQKENDESEVLENHREFEKSQCIESIIGATNAYSRLQFLVKWKSAHGVHVDLIDAPRVNIKYPQDVIAFYQKRVEFE